MFRKKADGTDTVGATALSIAAPKDRVNDSQDAAQSGKDPAPDGVERLALAFERSAKRWEMIVYPAMLLFTFLAAYGFYQVHSLSRDIRLAARQLEPAMGVHMTRLTVSMGELTDNIAQMSRSIKDMQDKVAKMSTDTGVIAKRMDHLQSMDAQMLAMNRSMSTMAMSTDRMRWSMSTMNRSISKPMNFMSSFMPW